MRVRIIGCDFAFDATNHANVVALNQVLILWKLIMFDLVGQLSMVNADFEQKQFGMLTFVQKKVV